MVLSVLQRNDIITRFGGLGFGIFYGIFQQRSRRTSDTRNRTRHIPGELLAGGVCHDTECIESVIIPIAGLILTFIACYELIQLIIDHNNLANYETWMDINMNYSEENNPIALKTTVSNRELKSMVEFYKKDLIPKYDIPEL